MPALLPAGGVPEVIDVDEVRVRIDSIGRDLFRAIHAVNHRCFPQVSWTDKDIHLMLTARSLVKLTIDLAEEVERLQPNTGGHNADRAGSQDSSCGGKAPELPGQGADGPEVAGALQP